MCTLYFYIFVCVCVVKFSAQLHDIKHFGGARGVMVIVVGNEYGDTRSNPGRD